MNRKRAAGISRIVSAASVIAIAALAPNAAIAQQLSDQWQWRGIIYGYFPSIGGATRFPARTGGTSVDVDADTVLRNLKFAFMGTLEVQKGRWGGFSDVMYVDIGGSKSQTRDVRIGGVDIPVGVTADLSLDVKGWIWTSAVSYRAVSDTDGFFDVFGGVRMLDMDQRLGWQFSANVGPINGPGIEGDAQVSLTNWDAIVGAKGRYRFGQQREWFLPYYVDAGGGDSRFTWQGIGGIGYAFSWGELVAVWRYIGYDFKSGDKIERLNFSGPAIGVAFRF